MNSYPENSAEPDIKPVEQISKSGVFLTAFSLSIIMAIALLFFAPVLRKPLLFLNKPVVKNAGIMSDDIGINKEIKKYTQDLKKLQRQYDRFVPTNVYAIINTNADYFYIMKGRKILREGMCSTGSYIMLTSHDQRTWIFQTPRGLFRIIGKVKRPIWHKPDWAFIEEGLPVPPPLSDERFERGVLGDYALAIGHGYLIHGTLYKRFLGLPVTHGCIRMGDEDLEYAYNNLGLGSKVFIY